MSKVVWFIELTYYVKQFKVIFPGKDDKEEYVPHKLSIVAFSKEEAKDLIAECTELKPGASVSRIRKPQLRGLTNEKFREVEKVLLKRLEEALLDLETDPGKNAELEKKIAHYREVGRWMFCISDERMRK